MSENIENKSEVIIKAPHSQYLGIIKEINENDETVISLYPDKFGINVTKHIIEVLEGYDEVSIGCINDSSEDNLFDCFKDDKTDVLVYKTDEIEIVSDNPKVKEQVDELKTIYQLIKDSLFKNKDLPKQPDDKNKVRPFAVNMALLFELSARAAVNKAIKTTPWELQKYVINKSSKADDNKSRTVFKIDKPTGKFPKNHISDGKGKSEIIPDIVLKRQNENDDSAEYIVLDAKYKSADKRNRDDRLQILAYAYLYDAHLVGHILPESKCIKVPLDTEFHTNAGDVYEYIQFGLDVEEISKNLEEYLNVPE